MLLAFKEPVRIERLDETLHAPSDTKLFMGIEILQEPRSVAAPTCVNR